MGAVAGQRKRFYEVRKSGTEAAPEMLRLKITTCSAYPAGPVASAAPGDVFRHQLPPQSPFLAFLMEA